MLMTIGSVNGQPLVAFIIQPVGFDEIVCPMSIPEARAIRDSLDKAIEEAKRSL